MQWSDEQIDAMVEQWARSVDSVSRDKWGHAQRAVHRLQRDIDRPKRLMRIGIVLLWLAAMGVIITGALYLSGH